MEAFSGPSGDNHFSQTSRTHWLPHIASPSHPHASRQPFPSPPSSSISEHGQHYFYPQGTQPASSPQGAQQSQSQPGSSSGVSNHGVERISLPRSSSTLSLNISGLSVTSPSNLSPISAPSGPSSALSPATPLSPSGNPFGSHNQIVQTHYHYGEDTSNNAAIQGHSHNPSQNTFDPDMCGPSPPSNVGHTRPSRSSSSTSSTSLPSRKRSFTSNPSSSSTSATNVSLITDQMPFDASRGDTPMDIGFDDGSDIRSYHGRGSSSTPGPCGGANSPGDGGSGGSGEEGSAMGSSGGGGVINGGGNLSMIGKPMSSNNFVSKLYQMINDSKSAHYINWTELGTSFVVSNVGEFSRSILGSHFKHNNFSSFVRQLNMYGFHKINRTPRAQRTSTDVQTWEFSHHKFLRGRPDLLEEIKRKALEPDPSVKHRVELPGEVAAQLGAMRDENRRMWEELEAEKRKTEKMVNILGRLWDVVSKGFPGAMPPFPSDSLEGVESPNIYITSPTSSTSRYPPPLQMSFNQQPIHTMHSLNSPSSSPTNSDFPSHAHQQHPHNHNQHQHHRSLSRQQSFSNMAGWRPENSPLPNSPADMNMEYYEEPGPGDGDSNAPTGRASAKRQRVSNGGLNGSLMNGMGTSAESMAGMSSSTGPGPGGGSGIPAMNTPAKRLSRARSDSAPLGYNGLTTNWSVTPGISGRPRSGSGMGPAQVHQQMRGLPVPNIGNSTRNNGLPMPNISVPSNNIPPNR